MKKNNGFGTSFLFCIILFSLAIKIVEKVKDLLISLIASFEENIDFIAPFIIIGIFVILFIYAVISKWKEKSYEIAIREKQSKPSNNKKTYIDIDTRLKEIEPFARQCNYLLEKQDMYERTGYADGYMPDTESDDIEQS